MEQKLLAVLSRRTAWILIAACAAFWLLLATGLLQAPLGIPPTLMFLWMYSSLMLALASTLVAAAAVAALVLHRSDSGDSASGSGPAGPEDPGGWRGLYLLLQRQFKKQ